MTEFSTDDYRYMSRALQLAKKGVYTTRPNPNVGCVIVKDDVVLGEGFHYRSGREHAEVCALQNAANDVNGATVYVTLEPCCHSGKTGPCTQVLIEAGVSRVVCAMQDPNPAVSGKGIDLLRAAGIAVECGLLQPQAEALNEGYVQRMRLNRPKVRIKLAMSIDGRTAMQSGESQWITGAAARSDVQQLRAKSCAIITGIGSIIQDDSSLTVRAAELKLDNANEIVQQQPLRVVLDSENKLSAAAKILHQPGRTLRVSTPPCDAALGEDCIALPASAGKVDLAALLGYLAEHEQCNEVLVEAGATLAGSFVSQGLFDELVVYMAPTLLGSNARPLLNLPFDEMCQQQRLVLKDSRFIGQDIRLTYVISRQSQ